MSNEVGSEDHWSEVGFPLRSMAISNTAFVSDVTRRTATEVWEAMRETHFPFALIDPTTHLFVDANNPYAALFELDASEIKGVSVLSLYDPEVGTTIESLHGAFARGTLEIIRGQGSLRRSNGATIELDGWSRRIDGILERPLVVTSAVEAKSETTLPDDDYWVAQAPHVFGFPDDWSEHPQNNAARRADQLEKHMWRIAVEVRAAGLTPAQGEALPLDPIQELGEMTTRQREIVARLAAGERVKEIARDMFLSPSTVRNHLTAVFRRFGVHSQLELISVLKDLSAPRP
jgi:DNA-binding CsgD family transcriptional regulator